MTDVFVETGDGSVLRAMAAQWNSAYDRKMYLSGAFGSRHRAFCANPLQQRRDHHSEENAPRERAPWYVCACCPPNMARTVAQLSAYVATVTDGALWLHQLADAEIDLPAELGTGTARMVTGYPADGRVEIRVEGDVVPGAELSVRIPGWSPRSTVVGPDTASELGDEHSVTAIPFSTWGNRAPGPMRVWLPRAPR